MTYGFQLINIALMIILKHYQNLQIGYILKFKQQGKVVFA